MSLSDNAHRLTEAHMTVQDGRYAKVPALLDQLENAVKPGSAGGRSGGMSLPINVEAIDLLRSMDGEARDYMHELSPGWRGTLRDAIRFWAREDISGEDMAFYEHVTLDWCDLITGLLKPKKPRRKMPIPCPSCGVKFHGDERAYALTANCWDAEEDLMHPQFWDVSCSACGAAWFGDELRWLTAALKAADTPTIAERMTGV